MGARDFSTLPLLIHTDAETAEEYAARIKDRARGVDLKKLYDLSRWRPSALTSSELQLLRAALFLMADV